MKKREKLYGDDTDDNGTTAKEVIDVELPEWIETGVVDKNGRPIYRRRSVKFGFVP